MVPEYHVSSLTGLSKRQVQVLWAVHEINEDGLPATGAALVEKFQESALDSDAAQVSVQGLHQTAASLVRKKALEKGWAGNVRTRGVAYARTPHGDTLLAREVRVHGRPL